MSELRLPKPDSQRANDTDFARLAELLAKDDRTILDERILAAFPWAGRATVDLRREEAFLLYMIALESLVLGKSAQSEITFQLKAKTAHLVGDRADQRRRLMKRLGDLYKLRSQIVHTGSFQVTDAEVSEARHYVKTALITVIRNESFKDINIYEKFDDWLVDRLLA